MEYLVVDDIVVKQEPEDDVDIENNEEPELLNEPSTSIAVSNDESTLPYDHIEEKEIKEEVLDTPPEPNYDEIGEFCFESDHLALKSNTDYKNLLEFLMEHEEAIVILEAQRSQAIKDLDRLLECQEEALADPIKFVARLQKNENLQIPAMQKIHQLPVIDWGKYALSGNPSVFGRRQLTRLSTKVAQDFGKNVGGKGKPGRNVETKPKSSQYWTAEEQKKLEELLVQFPPEEVETRRWEKIANCLENRTPIQVASRVQKYFIKLMKAGIPVPGRMPNTTYLKKPRRNVIRQQPSTFLVSHQLPVYMPDADEQFNYGYSQAPTMEENSLDSKMELSDDEEITSDVRNTPEFHELMLLTKVKKEKLKSSGLAHLGYKCCQCKVEPIMGVRWHCTECKAQSIDFCADCVECEYETGSHTSGHRLESIHEASTAFLDRDYMHFLGSSDYNYLDPNYMPAT